jgi:hypothetical protein
MGAENRCLEEQLYGGTGGDVAVKSSSMNRGTLTVGKTYWGLARSKQRSSVSSDFGSGGNEEVVQWA